MDSTFLIQNIFKIDQLRTVWNTVCLHLCLRCTEYKNVLSASKVGTWRTEDNFQRLFKGEHLDLRMRLQSGFTFGLG